MANDTDLRSILMGMIASVREAKSKPKLREKKTAAVAPIKPPSASAGERAQQNWRALIKWQDQAILLVVVKTECRGCKATFEAPAPYLMLQRWHRTYGRHITPLEAHMAKTSTLPRRQETITTTVQACQHCWAGRAPFEAKQPSLPIFPENQGILVEADGGIKLTDLFSKGEGISGEHEVRPHQGAIPVPVAKGTFPELLPNTVMQGRWLVPLSQTVNLQPNL